MTSILPPKFCPSCGSTLQWNKHLLYCRNPECLGKREKYIQHFAKSLKIKGLGPATIAKLNLSNLNELYELEFEDLAFILSSERIAEKLIEEIENSKKASLNKLLPAFSIPLVGKVAAEKLSTICETIYDITADKCKEAGLGPKVTENLLEWLKSEFPLLKDLPFDFAFETPNKVEKVKGVVCISGKLKTFKTKAVATKVLEDSGYVVKPSLTKDVTILVNESGAESTKTKQAVKNGITIVTDINQLLTGENL